MRYLASGESQQSLSFSYRLGRTTVCHAVRDTCKAIWKVLSDDYLRPPSTKEEWAPISQDFQDLWNLPHCIGAIDGKHISMDCPKNSGSLFYNYKGWFSIVLLAVCDARYFFTLVDVGDFGSNNDSGILASSEMQKGFESNEFDLPSPSAIPGCKLEKVPYFLVGDEIFPLKTWLMRPYPGKQTEDKRIFNYRLSRAWRVIENTFGILAARWRVFRRPIRASVKTVEIVTKAALCLHNYLRQTDNATYCPSGFIDSEDSTGNIIPGEWRNIVRKDSNAGALQHLRKARGCRINTSVIKIRDEIKDYLNSEEGQVHWQWQHVRKTGGSRN